MISPEYEKEFNRYQQIRELVKRYPVYDLSAEEWGRFTKRGRQIILNASGRSIETTQVVSFSPEEMQKVIVDVCRAAVFFDDGQTQFGHISNNFIGRFLSYEAEFLVGQGKVSMAEYIEGLIKDIAPQIKTREQTIESGQTMVSAESMPSKGKPESMLRRLPKMVSEVIVEKKRFLKKQFGDASDYSIKGVVVVGSSTTVRGSESIDLFVLSTSDTYDTDFVQELERKTKGVVWHLGTIIIKEGQEFTVEDWQKEKAQTGYPPEYPFRIIMAR